MIQASLPHLLGSNGPPSQGVITCIATSSFATARPRPIRSSPSAIMIRRTPEDLWRWMAAYEEKTGGRLLAIPHNGNLSNGPMFDVETRSGQPLDRDYAERRMR